MEYIEHEVQEVDTWEHLSDMYVIPVDVLRIINGYYFSSDEPQLFTIVRIPKVPPNTQWEYNFDNPYPSVEPIVQGTADVPTTSEDTTSEVEEPCADNQNEETKTILWIIPDLLGFTLNGNVVSRTWEGGLVYWDSGINWAKNAAEKGGPLATIPAFVAGFLQQNRERFEGALDALSWGIPAIGEAWDQRMEATMDQVEWFIPAFIDASGEAVVRETLDLAEGFLFGDSLSDEMAVILERNRERFGLTDSDETPQADIEISSVTIMLDSLQAILEEATPVETPVPSSNMLGALDAAIGRIPAEIAGVSTETVANSAKEFRDALSRVYSLIDQWIQQSSLIKHGKEGDIDYGVQQSLEIPLFILNFYLPFEEITQEVIDSAVAEILGNENNRNRPYVGSRKKLENKL